MFGAHISPACLYCEFSQQTDDDCQLLCLKQGIVTPSYHCRKYSYDPTKRVPPKKLALPKFSPGDFDLNS